MHRLVLLVVCCMAFSACAIVPGQRMDVGELKGDPHVTFVPITYELVTSTQQDATVPADFGETKPVDYTIGPGDTLYITVWNHPELTSPAGTQQQTVANGRPVGTDGTFYFPHVGVVRASGKTVPQLRDELSKALTDYVKEPQVDVTVVQYASQRISLEGAFRRTDPAVIGAVPLTLGEAMGTAGVDPALADLSGLTLTRNGKTYRIDASGTSGQPLPVIWLQPGDRIYLPFNDNHEVYVVGEVMRPAALSFRTAHISLTQAIGRAGGLSPVTANANEVYVIRGSKNLSQTPTQVFHLEARSPAAFGLADAFPVEAGDVVFVGASGVTKWNRVLSQLLPLSGFIYNASRVDNPAN
ncbi:polysaccharide biosynthesis/export family protein [Luteibacter sp. NPDC031894]|jgi:polysaccharide biosynthesis/export protein|uniref:polysaccharide biosynthesis/export family protein n=1 Tax=Luteibacter sp. NPDC031894 TaxID=3390572 RepID=UPI003D06FDA9